MNLAARIRAYREVVMEWLRGLYHGMISHPAYEKIEQEAEDLEDAFLALLADGAADSASADGREVDA